MLHFLAAQTNNLPLLILTLSSDLHFLIRVNLWKKLFNFGSVLLYYVKQKINVSNWKKLFRLESWIFLPYSNSHLGTSQHVLNIEPTKTPVPHSLVFRLNIRLIKPISNMMRYKLFPKIILQLPSPERVQTAWLQGSSLQAASASSITAHLTR